jgi:hypothetical protein
MGVVPSLCDCALFVAAAAAESKVRVLDRLPAAIFYG